MLAWLGVTLGIFGVGIAVAMLEEVVPAFWFIVVLVVGIAFGIHYNKTQTGQKPKDGPKDYDNLPY